MSWRCKNFMSVDAREIFEIISDPCSFIYIYIYDYVLAHTSNKSVLQPRFVWVSNFLFYKRWIELWLVIGCFFVELACDWLGFLELACDWIFFMNFGCACHWLVFVELLFINGWVKQNKKIIRTLTCDWTGFVELCLVTGRFVLNFDLWIYGFCFALVWPR